jgi:starch phosphorylase
MTKTASKSASRKSEASAPEPISAEALRTAVAERLYNTVGSSRPIRQQARPVHGALAGRARPTDHRWRKTTDAHYEANPKFAYYLSAEYMMGKQLGQNLLYTGTTEVAAQLLAALA